MKSLIFTLIAMVIAQVTFACSANFTYSTSAVNNNLLLLNYTTTSVMGSVPGGSYLLENTMYFGDGSSSMTYGNTSSSHNYASPGTYNVWLYTQVVDSAYPYGSYCIDSIHYSVTISYSTCAASWTSVAGSAGSETFTAINPGGATGLTYVWFFGDGTYGFGNPVTHTYATNGSFTVTMDDSSSAGCTYSNVGGVYVSNASGGTPGSCVGSHARFDTASSGLLASFTNNSVDSSSYQASTSSWSFGDGSTSTSTSPNHTYAAAGTYTVRLIMTWYDTLSFPVVTCRDTVIHSITVASGGGGTILNQISGSIITDSSSTGNPINPTFKVWLIRFDSASNDLSAVDSVSVIGSAWVGNYLFSGEPAGSYRVKAMLTNGPTSGTAAVPTYGFDSLYWHGAHVINYSGSGVNTGNDIFMQNGSVTSGPGFVAGNVSMGANKGTKSTGVPAANMTIFLETSSGHQVAYTLTDANGNYHFSNFPTGSYNIYPECLGYATTVANVTAGATQVTGVNFTQHTASKTIVPGSTGVVNVTENSSSFNIFPNPSNGVFNISWSSKIALRTGQVVVTDIVGNKVFETELNMSNLAGQAQVNLSNLVSGMYFFNISAGGVNYTNKVVLSH